MIFVGSDDIGNQGINTVNKLHDYKEENQVEQCLEVEVGGNSFINEHLPKLSREVIVSLRERSYF